MRYTQKNLTIITNNKRKKITEFSNFLKNFQNSFEHLEIILSMKVCKSPAITGDSKKPYTQPTNFQSIDFSDSSIIHVSWELIYLHRLLIESDYEKTELSTIAHLALVKK